MPDATAVLRIRASPTGSGIGGWHINLTVFVISLAGLKRLLCISLVLLHLLNSVAGYWLFYGLQQRNRALRAYELDADAYAGSETITIKLPLTQPVSDKENYERVDGEIEYEGTVYRLIKQKFYKDTAYIVAYKDQRSLSIRSALKDYLNSFTDDPQDKRSEHKFAGLFIKDYVHTAPVTIPWDRRSIEIHTNTRYLNSYQHLLDLIVDHPPKVIA